MDTVLSIRNISKNYGNVKVLKSIDLEVLKGEIHGLVGANGSGKSTLLNILFGNSIIKNTGGYQGEIYLNGKPIKIESTNDALDHGIGMIHQEFNLISEVYSFNQTKLGRAMQVVGENETFAYLSGINVIKMRNIAIVLSTVLGAIGICVYAQSYGFVELYTAPLMMAFPAASAILIGGSTGRRTSIGQVIIGTYLFQTIYVLSGPVANEILIPEFAELTRMIITNLIILHALLFGGIRKNAQN